MTTETWETFEERLTTLEQEMNRVKARLEPETVQPPNPWLDHVYGAFKDDPLFDEAIKHGREWRESQNTEENEADDVPVAHG